MGQNADTNKGQKLPMYYEQIYNLIKIMARSYINGEGFRYFRIFRQLYSNVRSDLNNDRKEYYDKKIKDIAEQYSPNENEKAYEIVFREKQSATLHFVYELEVELFQDIKTQTDIFNYLKQNINPAELV